ncbi:MAG: sigma-54-dependent Fis family transcriptional regulator [Deltaproteobacteria bacterium]|nr:sigma-54-dependent Fis family transcriptional regulator [Deltaproteobacteria bacterium]
MSQGLDSGPRRILVVDDEPAMRDTLSILFRRESYGVEVASGCQSAIRSIREADTPFPVVLTDLRMPDGDGFEVLEAAKRHNPATEVIVMTAYHEHAYDAMRRGAYDFVAKPFPSLREVVERVGKAFEKATIVAENELLRARVGESILRPWVAQSPAMRKILDIIDKVAATRTTVLITGESGTGKERIARLLHDRSDRASAPFLVVNCGALPEALIESELFGHEKGAFTGASSKHVGLLREAEGGTLLLDEIGDLPIPLQVKLLRVLQERKVRPVGASTEFDVDVRILAATNRNVDEQVAAGTFRRDLFYRLNVIRLELPPLRERREDLPMLVEAFVRRFGAEQGKAARTVSKDAFRRLNAYPFPGNVRELENVIERAVALADGAVIGVSDLPDEVACASVMPGPAGIELPEQGCNLDDVLGTVERQLLLQALDRAGSVRKAAAGLLGISFRSMRYRLSKHGIDVGDDAPDSEVTDEEPPSSERQELSPAVRKR